MTREQYIRMTEATRRAADRLPGRAKALRAPTLLCAAIYCASLLYLMFTGDGRIVRAVLVPAACFAVVTALRPLLGKQRPYDRYGAPPVGAYSPGKGKSMPSRHTASAAAIACMPRHMPSTGMRRAAARRTSRLRLSASGGRRLHGAALRADRRPARALRPARSQRRSGRAGAEPRALAGGVSALISTRPSVKTLLKPRRIKP